jgi:hypothetical protein
VEQVECEEGSLLQQWRLDSHGQITAATTSRHHIDALCLGAGLRGAVDAGKCSGGSEQRWAVRRV